MPCATTDEAVAYAIMHLAGITIGITTTRCFVEVKVRVAVDDIII